MKGASREISSGPKIRDWRSIIHCMKSGEPIVAKTAPIYLSYSLRLKQVTSLPEITALLSEILDHHLFPNVVIINQLITKLGQLQHVHEALELHDIAVEKKVANAITYASTINALAKSREPDVKLAMDLLNKAKKLGYADAITYASTINVIAKSREPDAKLAVFLLNEAKKLGYIDAILYACTLDAIAKSPEPDEVLAFKYLDEATKKFALPDMQHQRWVDLHGLSFGEVYFGFKRRLQTELDERGAKPIHLDLIYGKGLHSHVGPFAIHPLKEAVVRVVQEMAPYGVSCKENKYNAGRAELTISPFSLFARPKKNEVKPDTDVVAARLK